MQRGKYIARFMKFIYVMIYFLFLFLVATKSKLDCRNDLDCKDIKCKPGWVAQCSVTNRCRCVPSSKPGSGHPWRTRPKKVHKFFMRVEDDDL
ncbi:unnamed protein product [Trifolium pratense]|uniref:Uncharacterized protein n=1 Tax=Trifolium pratense TaxID=57577 RepID=A0ACB0IYJ5_TRIPR|nr:unnamed protein product [Trifolium pratense]